MNLQDQVNELTAKNKTLKIVIVAVTFIGAAILALMGMPDQSKQLIQIGEQAAVVQYSDTSPTIISATAPVSITEISPTK